MFSEFPGDGVVDALVVFPFVGGVIGECDKETVDTVDDTEAGELDLFIEHAAGESFGLAGGELDGEHLAAGDLEAGVFLVCVRGLRVHSLGDFGLASLDFDGLGGFIVCHDMILL